MVYLGPRGGSVKIGVLYPPYTNFRETSVTAQLKVLHKPKKIIKNLLSALLETAEENKEKIRELDLGMLYAVSE